MLTSLNVIHYTILTLDPEEPLEQGRYQEALAAYDSAIQLAPEASEAYQGKAVVLYRLGQMAEALQSCEKALQLRPDFAEAQHIKVGILLTQGKLKEAMTSCEEAIRLCPTAATAHHLKAGILKEQGRFQEAIKACEQALQLNPDLLPAHELRKELQPFNDSIIQYEEGLSLLNARQYAAALDVFNVITQSAPEFVEAFHCKGLALGNLGRHEESLAAWLFRICG